MERTIQDRIRMAGRQLLPWNGMSIDDMERACAVIDAVAAEFGDDRTYNPATHVVISRDRLARHIETLDSLPVTTLAVSQVAAELRAALEVK